MEVGFLLGHATVAVVDEAQDQHGKRQVDALTGREAVEEEKGAVTC